MKYRPLALQEGEDPWPWLAPRCSYHVPVGLGHGAARRALGQSASCGLCHTDVLGTAFCPTASFLLTGHCLNPLPRSRQERGDTGQVTVTINLVS